MCNLADERSSEAETYFERSSTYEVVDMVETYLFINDDALEKEL